MCDKREWWRRWSHEFICDMTHPCVPWLIRTCHDSATCVTWLIYMCNRSTWWRQRSHWFVWDMTHACGSWLICTCHDSAIYVTWLIYTCNRRTWWRRWSRCRGVRVTRTRARRCLSSAHRCMLFVCVFYVYAYSIHSTCMMYTYWGSGRLCDMHEGQVLSFFCTQVYIICMSVLCVCV